VPDFRYTAKNIDGDVATGIYDVPDKVHVVRMLRQRGYFPITVERVEKSTNVAELGIFGRVTIRDIALFCRQFSTLLTAGLPLIQIMEVLGEQNKNVKLKRAVLEVAESVRTGRTLSDSMKERKYFPQLLVNMVAAGEMGGTLDKVLDTMSSHYEKEHKIKQKVKTAMIYPVIVLIITMAVIYFLLTFVVPTFADMFEGMGLELPVTTRILLSLSAFASAYGLLLFAVLILGSVLFRYVVSKGDSRYKWHKFILKTPAVGKLTVLIMSSRFTRTMSTLLNSGAPLIDALEMTKKVMENAVAERGLTDVQEKIRLGGGLWGPLGHLKLFPAMVVHMVRVGEEAGTLDEVLANIARFYEEETEGYMLKLTTLMEPALILVLGAVVAFVVLSIALPMFDMMGMVN
jgi:type IV pilus assembly protein PilC